MCHCNLSFHSNGICLYLEVLCTFKLRIEMTSSLLSWLILGLTVVCGCDGFGIGSTLYCYQCVSTHPGCGTPFEWIWHWSQACPEVDDKCVKLIEKRGATEVITRDCLSSLKSFRTDIPADHYEGCRPATVDVKLANYVNNSIKELDVKKTYYDQTTWCFCFLDNRCNGAATLESISLLLILSLLCSTMFV